MSLKNNVYELLENARQLCQDYPEADGLQRLLTGLSERLDQPLRVAIAGDIKAGKSTFLNALMGCELVHTGTDETTYTVCWFHYADTPSITVRFRNGSHLAVPFEDLKKWSVRSSTKDNPKLAQVAYLDIYYPSKILKTMEFVDTPGLDSVYGTDSQNTLDFLSLKSSQDTLTAAGNADAVIFAYQRSLTDRVVETLTKFHGSSQQTTSPINAIGIQTLVDKDWDVYSFPQLPTDHVRPMLGRYMQRRDICRILYSILPVCAKPVTGVQSLDQESWDALRHYAAIDPDILCELLSDVDQFNSSDDEEFRELGSVQIRRKLSEKLAPFGILAVTDLLRSGTAQSDIPDRLQELCGIQAVRQMVVSHFGNRTFLIKTQYIFNQLRAAIDQIRYAADSSASLRAIAGRIKDEIELLSGSCQTLQELEVLQMFYNGQLPKLSEEERQDLLHISGEYGRYPHQKLDMPESSTIPEMVLQAEVKAGEWNCKAALGLLPSSEYIHAAGILAHSYEVMHFHMSALIEE